MSVRRDNDAADRLLVAVDVDGTLVHTEMEDALRGAEIRAVRKVRDAGHVLALCTGRSARSAESIIRLADGSLDGVAKILLNGALVLGEDDGRVLRDGGLPRETCAELVDMFRATGAMPISFDMESDGGRLRVERTEPNPVLARYLERRREKVGPYRVVDDLVADLPDVSQEVGTIAEAEVALELAQRVRDRFGDEVWVVSTETLLERDRYRWLEIMPPDCNKGSGLKVLADDLGVPQERIVAIGDNYNDLEMFMAAGHAVAMGNAPDDVRAAAHRVAPHVADSGAAAVLEEIADGVWPSTVPETRE